MYLRSRSTSNSLPYLSSSSGFLNNVYRIDEETKRKVDVYEGEGYLFKCVDVDIYVNQEVLKGIVYEYIIQDKK